MAHKPFTVGAVLDARITPAQRKAHAMAHLDSIRGFMPAFQAITIEQLMRGEEKQFFYDKLEEYAKRIAEMPATRGQEGKGDRVVAYLHYFAGGCDWYITEKDIGAEDDRPSDFQSQAFGYARLFPGGGGLGYISLPEIFAVRGELDLNFNPMMIEAVKEKLGEN